MKRKSLYEARPDIAKLWHPIRNGDLTPNNISFRNHKVVWWMCENGHEWEESVNNRTNPNNGPCPFCSGKRVCIDNCLATLFPKIAEQWHPILNENLTPYDVLHGSEKKVWWKCITGKKGHEWVSTVNNRTNMSWKKKNLRDCPFCGGKKACEDNCLSTLSPEIAKEWHPSLNGTLTPNDFTCGSDKQVWWLCNKCGHEWEARINKRCEGEKSCKKCISLFTLRPDIAAQWHPILNGRLTSIDVTCGSSKKVWWLCENGHEWEAHIYNRVAGKGCSICSRSNVSKISQEWLDSLNIPEECREISLSNLNYKVDAFVQKTNTVYEFFGDYWHGNPEIFSPRKKNSHNGKTFGELYEKTKTRISRLEEAGYKVVYIWENDFRKSSG